MQRCMQRCLIHLLIIGLVIWAAFSSYVAVALTWRCVHNGQGTFGGLMVAIPTISLLAATVVLLVIVPSFIMTQPLLGAALFLFCRRLSFASACALLASLVVLSLVSFECYDYLIPSYRFFLDPGPKWVHGLSERRWLIFFGIQSCLAVFSGWRLHRAKLLPHRAGA